MSEKASDDLPELVLVEDASEDEWMSLRGIEKARIPCRVTVKRDGISAQDYLLQQADSIPALVLLDFDLPGKNGLEILQAIRAADHVKLTPVVIFSGDHSNQAVIDCYLHGANSWVKKPNDSHTYLETIANLVRYWLNIHNP